MVLDEQQKASNLPCVSNLPECCPYKNADAQHVHNTSALTIGALTIGALTIGALTIGALTIGALTIGALTIGALTIGALTIGALTIVALCLLMPREFHVAYVYIRMGNSPRPGVWILERSKDFGKTWLPWQYFAENPSDCSNLFNTRADERLTSDTQIICSTEFSKIVPFNNGEIVVSLVNGRPNAHNFTYADELQEWTRATDIRLALLRTKTLLGHLMAIARQDPTVTRRYYYSIKDINIGGRCVCNGHAESCDVRDPTTSKLVCSCIHNTCGERCERCCAGYPQKKWRSALVDQPFLCEPCECYGHADDCVYDEEVARNRSSIDIHGNYDGGGVCQNCKHNTMGINCEQCVFGYYRPYHVAKNATDACRPCECDPKISTGECEEGSGRCLCRPEYAGLACDRCNFGYYGYPDCIPCECDINGTEDSICTSGTGHCPCKYNYDGVKCNQCAQGYYNFPECKPCECNRVGSQLTVCDLESGQCRCDERYGGRDCGECANGFYNFPQCLNCGCDSRGTKADICDKESGVCLCNDRYAGSQCNRCAPGFYNFPICQECQCASPGSKTSICAENGQCLCHNNFGGLTCNHCAPGFYKYPECSLCNCDVYGSIGASCDQVTGQCRCRDNFVGVTCNKCGPNLYNYPNCEECNCHPDGAKAVPGYPAGGCGSVTVGRLCECKDLVIGRNCDTCKTGYWNLNRNNPGGCEECNCHSPGTLAGVNRCDMLTGQCECKPRVGGRDCNRCLDGYYNLQENNPFGCVDCNCDRGGSVRMACDKTTGQCQCKQRVTGQKCDKAITGNFVPTLHQYKFEVEDGVTPEGARIKYGYDENIFPNFSWRGYGILTKVQPEVKLDVNIRSPSLYQIIYRFTNREDKLIKGKVTLTSDSPTEITQTGELSFVQSKDPRFTTVSSGNTQSSFVLNPGIWIVSTTVPDQVQLDYFVLIPQGYYEASQVQQAVKNPCNVTGDPGPCVHFSYPDLFGNPTGLGKNGYVELDGMRGDAQQNPNELLSNNLGSPGLVHITEQQRGFWIDLDVPTPDEYLIIVSYHNPKNVSKDLDVQVRTTAGSRDGKITLASCPFGSLCRQVIKDQNGFEAIFNITTGVASIYISAPDAGQDTDVSIDSVYGVKRSVWNHDYIMPRIICIKVNGVCITSTYGHPVGSVRIEFEQSPNEALISTVPPPDIHDKNAGLVNLDDTIKFVDQTLCPIHENDKADQCKTEKLRTVIPITLFGKVTKPGQYVFVVHYYMPSLAGLNIPITMYVDGKEFTGTFSPIYCPNIVGCRETIKFDATGGNALRMTATDVKVVFNSTTGGKIWLDYLLIVPQDQYKYDVLDVQPIDKSGEFLNLCVDEGFQLRSDEEFCKDGAFTLTTNFNNGALDCNCNPDGSRSFTCDSFGGNCQCRENIIGRTCSACRPGFYGFPNCKACNCPYGLCHEVTGECICPQLVEGSKCDVCKPQAYGYDALIGCQLCRCNSAGVENGNLNCDQISGQCNCKPNIGGRKCDICLPGYHTFPYCQDCGCDRKGTKSGICDTSTGQCICKENVEGSLCESCSDGYFSLTAENPKGCIRCFCFGHTTRCDSAGLSWDQVNEMSGWQVTNAGNSQVNTVFNTAQLVFEADDPEEKNNVYWVAPAAFLGRQVP
ncbi:laminin subunit alpha-like [Physella acuta]|uniref:laminin subunit alpha-like n=1 Tax=Physella acuta TaxID=109671 RepID=UPI0027DB39E9|nr:laminin subunit alpha-like [Physella acuta]